MKIEFKYVQEDYLEQVERAKHSNLHGENNLPTFNERDRLKNIVIDLDDVFSYRQSNVYYNDEEKEGVRVLEFSGSESPLLICPYEIFHKIFQEYKKEKILNIEQHETIIKEIRTK